MLYSTTFENGKKMDFNIYDYHYQNPDLTQQFASAAFNVIILFERTGSTYTHLETVVDNPKDYLVYGLPTDSLYKTSKILLPATIDYKDQEEGFKSLFKEISNHFNQPIPGRLLDKCQ